MKSFTKITILRSGLALNRCRPEKFIFALGAVLLLVACNLSVGSAPASETPIQASAAPGGGSTPGNASQLPGATVTMVPGQAASVTPTATRTATATVAPTHTVSPTNTLTATPAATPFPYALSGTPLPPAEAISADNAAAVTLLARWGNGIANGSDWSPDGKLLAVGSSLGVYLYDAQTLSELRFIETPVNILQVKFSPAGDLLAAQGNAKFYLFKMPDGALLTEVGETHYPVGENFAFLPDKSQLLAASGMVAKWNVSNGESDGWLDGMENVSNLALSPDGTLLATTGYYDPKIQLWQTSDWSPLSELPGHSYMTTALAFSPDGKTLASAGFDYTVRLWRVEDGASLMEITGLYSPVTELAFSPDGAILAINAGKVYAWNINTKTLQYEIGLSRPDLNDINPRFSFSPDGQTLAVAGTTIELHRVSDGTLLQTLPGFGPMVYDTVFSPDGAALAVAQGGVTLWQVPEAVQLGTFDGRNPAFSPDGAILATGGGEAWLWNVADGVLLHTLEKHTAWVTGLAFSPGGNYIASGAGDGTLRLWRAENGKRLRTLEGHADRITGMAFSPDGAFLATASSDHSVRIWLTASGERVTTLQHAEAVLAVAYSPDGSRLATAERNGPVQLWHAGNWARWLTLPATNAQSLAFSPDGTLLAAGMGDGTITLWRVEDGTLLATLSGHKGSITSLSFSPDGKLLVSGSYDGTVRFWGIK
jgi:WD40 repeat protein